MRLLSVVLLLLTGCKEYSLASQDSAPLPTPSESDADTDADADADTDLDTDGPEACTTTVTQLWPADGATDVALTTSIEVDFDGVVEDSQPWSLSVVGMFGEAELTADGMGAVFTPIQPLEADTTYTVEASVCASAASATFTTLHAPLDPADVEGQTYAVPFGSVTFVTPSIANTLDPADWILIQVREIDTVAETLSTVAGLGNGALPVPECESTFDAGLADFSANPQFSVGPQDFAIPWDTNQVTIEDFEVEAVIGVGGGTITDIVLLGNLDTRGAGIPDACFLSALLGSPCQACSDGAIQCLPVYATAPQGDAWPGVDVITTCGL